MRPWSQETSNLMQTETYYFKYTATLIAIDYNSYSNICDPMSSICKKKKSKFHILRPTSHSSTMKGKKKKFLKSHRSELRPWFEDLKKNKKHATSEINLEKI